MGITTSKYYTLTGGNTIVLDSNYSTQAKSLYIAVFRGKFLQDELGNVCFEIGANLREYSVESPNNTIWGLSTTDNGEIVSESGSTQAPDPIRIYRDDSTLVALEVTDDGVYSIDDNPTAGIAFETIALVSPNGSVWKLGVSNENEIYLDATELEANKFCLKDNRDNIVHEIQDTPSGAIFKLKHFNKGDLPETPDQVSQTTLMAIEQDELNGPRLMRYDTFSQEWRPLAGDGSQGAPIGEVRHSILPPYLFKERYGDDWEAMDGTVTLDATTHTELATLLPEWVEDDIITIPDSRDWNMAPQTWNLQTGNSANHAQGTARLAPPEGFNIGDVWAGIGSISRIYYAGGVDGNDTTVNDWYIDIGGNGTWTNTYNTEQRATAYSQQFVMYRKLRYEQRYIKVK